MATVAMDIAVAMAATPVNTAMVVAEVQVSLAQTVLRVRSVHPARWELPVLRAVPATPELLVEVVRADLREASAEMAELWQVMAVMEVMVVLVALAAMAEMVEPVALVVLACQRQTVERVVQEASAVMEVLAVQLD